MPKVDVVIPFYNTRVEFARAALASVVAQTFTDWRAIVVNDGSSESSTAEIEALVAEIDDPRILYIHQENKGLAGARNTAIRASDSPYIATLDSDDGWFPRKLERQVAVLDSRPDVEVVHSGAHFLYPDRMVHHRAGTAPCLGELHGERFFLRMLRNNIVWGTHTTIFRRCAAERVGLFDEEMRSLEDKELWLRLIADGCTFLYLDEPLAFYRQHETNMSKNVEHMWRGRVKLIDKLDALIPQLPQAWTRVHWSKRRRQMLQHAYIEAAETCLEAGESGRAWKYSMPWYTGVSAHSALVIVRSAYRLMRSVAAGAN
jgi:glycosyltransferase involved in cell wall biosynthesis